MRRLLLIVLLAAGCARDPVEDRRPRLSQQSVTLSTDTGSLVHPAPITTTGDVSRNIFAYREPPVVNVVAQKIEPKISTQPFQSIAVPQPQPQEPAAPPFPYKCLGTFGTQSQRFAVFSSQDGIVNATIGDVVGQSEFVLREIGVESVMIETKAGAFTRRVEIGH